MSTVLPIADPRMHYPNQRELNVNNTPNNERIEREARNEEWNNARNQRVASALTNIRNMNIQITSLREKQYSNFKHLFFSTAAACEAVSLTHSSLLSDYPESQLLIKTFLVTTTFVSVGYTFLLTYSTHYDLESAYKDTIRQERAIGNEYKNSVIRLEQRR